MTENRSDPSGGPPPAGRSDEVHADALKLRLSFDGSFDHHDALRTAGQLEGAIHGALVSLDFAHCAQVDPAGLAHLTEAIIRSGGKVEFRGLSKHDLQILHYLVGSLDIKHSALDDSD